MTKNAANLWNQTAGGIAFPALAKDLATDLVVIGGGFTGCSAALHASQAGADVCLVEAQTIGHGGSGRNVGLVNAGLWLPPESINAVLGKKQGTQLSSLLASTPSMVFSLIENFDIECEAVRNGTLHCAHSVAGLRDLQDRERQLKASGAPVELLPRAETAMRTGTDCFEGSLFDPRAGTVQPLAYAQGLARTVANAGARIFENTPALAIHPAKEGWKVETPEGTISAKKLLRATNAYMAQGTDIDPQHFIPVHYFQIATQPLLPSLSARILPNEEGCWDTATVMSSFRKDKAGRLLIGGIGNLEQSAANIHRNWARRKLASLFPDAADTPVEFAWCGRIAMTSDHIPKIVEIGPNALSCFGYSGRGIGPGTLFGRRTAEALLTGNQDVLPLEPIRTHSESFAGIRKIYYETGATLTHFLGNRR